MLMNRYDYVTLLCKGVCDAVRNCDTIRCVTLLGAVTLSNSVNLSHAVTLSFTQTVICNTITMTLSRIVSWKCRNCDTVTSSDALWCCDTVRCLTELGTTVILLVALIQWSVVTLLGSVTMSLLWQCRILRHCHMCNTLSGTMTLLR
jgi:hypothetical protein